MLYSTLLGGGSTDRGSGVVIDSSGNCYVAGYSGSPDFPTQNAFQGFSGGSFDAFIAKINPNASGAASLVFSTYLGGIGDDKAFGIAIDSGGNNVYVVGQTSSNNFPVLNPAQPAFGGSFDAFIAKISSTGTKIYATYLGGTGDDRGTGIAVNSAGAAYVTGFTSSTNFPTVTPLQISNAGGFDAFVAKLNPAGSAFLYSTYLGGSANESNNTAATSTNPIALDSSSDAYLTGFTSSTNFPTAAPLQPANAGGQDAFVVKIADATPAADYSISVLPGSRTVVPGGGTTYTVNATPVGGFTGTISLSASGFSNDSTATFQSHDHRNQRRLREVVNADSDDDCGHTAGHLLAEHQYDQRKSAAQRCQLLFPEQPAPIWRLAKQHRRTPRPLKLVSRIASSSRTMVRLRRPT